MLAWIRSLNPIFIENSRVPVLLSYVSPINIGAISFGPFVWSRSTMDERLRRHEWVHFQQQLELFFALQWLLYGGFYLFNLIKYRGNGALAYYNIAFEKEAYSHDEQEDYMATRPFYNWIGYIKNETKEL